MSVRRHAGRRKEDVMQSKIEMSGHSDEREVGL